MRETRAVWARSAAKAISLFPPNALTPDGAERLAERAAEVFAELAEQAPERFTVDALLLGTLRAVLRPGGARLRN